jgi:hypothetical protein
MLFTTLPVTVSPFFRQVGLKDNQPELSPCFIPQGVLKKSKITRKG